MPSALKLPGEPQVAEEAVARGVFQLCTGEYSFPREKTPILPRGNGHNETMCQRALQAGGERSPREWRGRQSARVPSTPMPTGSHDNCSWRTDKTSPVSCSFSLIPCMPHQKLWVWKILFWRPFLSSTCFAKISLSASSLTPLSMVVYKECAVSSFIFTRW
jgi:hypothetical protein